MNNNNEINWEDSVWQEINQGVEKEINKVRVAQKVFPTMSFENDPAQVQNEVIKFDDMSIEEGNTKVFVELSVKFTLTHNQVMQETQLMTAHTLARMAAKILALAEDMYFFQVSDGAAIRDPNDPARTVILPGNAVIENWRLPDDLGLLAEANPKDRDNKDPNKVSDNIPVPLSEGEAKWGENTFSAVAEGIANLVRKGQAEDYALILPTKVFADTFVPPSTKSLVTTAERIKPLVEGGFYSSGILPEDEGLLVALAGEPTRLYVGRKPAVEYVQRIGTKYEFRVMERIQYMVRDPRALVLLKFTDPAKGAAATAAHAEGVAAAAAAEAATAFAEAQAAQKAGDNPALAMAVHRAKESAKAAVVACKNAAIAAAKADVADQPAASDSAANAADSARKAISDSASADAL